MKKLLLCSFLAVGCAGMEWKILQSSRTAGRRGLAGVNQALVVCKNLKAPRTKKSVCRRLAEGDKISNLALSLCEKLWKKDEQKIDCLLESASFHP